jgi:hypothetical protein
MDYSVMMELLVLFPKIVPVLLMTRMKTRALRNIKIWMSWSRNMRLSLSYRTSRFSGPLFTVRSPPPCPVIRDRSVIGSIVSIRARCGKLEVGADGRSKEEWFPSSVNFMLAKYDHVGPTNLLFKDKLITGGHMGWSASHSRKLLLFIHTRS